MSTDRKYNCLVVDDEPIARKIIINYIEQLPLLSVAAEHINSLNAIEHLRAHDDVDIIFLDINMPNISGMQILKIVQPKQPVILTTAYTEYAVESYELNAVDYLLKPFSLERFTKAVFKAIDHINISDRSFEKKHRKQEPFYIKSDGKNYPVELDDILYCEAMKNYTKVVLKNGMKLMPLVPLSKFESLLSEAGGGFIQVHRSYLVSKNNITAVTSNNVVINNYEIPIGVQFKEHFFKTIGMKDGR